MRKKKSNRLILIILIPLCLLLLALFLVLLWQRETILLLWRVATESPQAVEQRQEVSKENLESQLGIAGMVDAVQIEEARQALMESSSDQSDPLDQTDPPEQLDPATESTGSADQPDQPDQIDQATEPTGSADQPDQPDQINQTAEPTPTPVPVTRGREEILQHYTALFYAMEQIYVGRIEAIAQQARREFAALPADQQTATRKWNIVYARLDQLTALESECDGQAAALLADLSNELGDAQVVKEFQDYYEQSKANLKASYLAQLGRS